mmetsp:Transcript_31582/g.35901  ORF Transcript_31582/g.35901 Transcript_31582/m.35901 type:complete len:108 (-) Transcript_31582:372-695(-)
MVHGRMTSTNRNEKTITKEKTCTLKKQHPQRTRQSCSRKTHEVVVPRFCYQNFYHLFLFWLHVFAFIVVIKRYVIQETNEQNDTGHECVYFFAFTRADNCFLNPFMP